MELLWQCEVDEDHASDDELLFYEDPGTFTEIDADTIIAKVCNTGAHFLHSHIVNDSII